MGNFLTSIGALGAADEIARKNAAASHDVDVSIARKNADIEDMNLRNNMLQSDQQFNQTYIEELKDEIEDLQREVEQYKQLLSKPMLEIANKNGNFKKTYDKQQEIIAKWMVSQQAFKNLTYQFADKLGLKDEDVAKKLEENNEQAVEQAAKKYPEVAKIKDKLKD